MKEILDTIVLIMFVVMVAFFIINFNRIQIKKHTDKLDELEANGQNTTSQKEKTDE
jgi:preprotein translocase subunit YajC